MKGSLTIVCFLMVWMSADCISWVGPTHLRQKLRGLAFTLAIDLHSSYITLAALARPNIPDSNAPMGAEPVGEYQRKTQSPVVWYLLRL